ncbi:MAG: HAD family hydrolase [Rhodococcus sp. (in: high G+C Gram-positive bacteria)]
MTSPAVLFDVDGTLVDSNYVHVHAWARAFADAGIAVESWRIHRSIGMDGGKLLSSLAGDADEDATGKAKELHSTYYQELSSLLSPLPGALDLLDAVAQRGLQVVLATSAPEDELDVLRRVLGVDDIVSEMTSSQDVETAKPDPSIVEIALDRAGVSVGGAVFVGDSVWDMTASTKVDLRCIGVRCGGVSTDELTEAGAAEVYDNPADLLARLESSVIGRLS